MKNGLLAIPAIAGGVMGLGATPLIASKAKNPIGSKGSITHILSNDKLDKEAKKDTFKQIKKEAFKDTGKLFGMTAGVAGIAAIATKSGKVTNKLKSFKKNAGTLLNYFSYRGKSMKDIIANTKEYKKFNTLPKPLKAGIGAAVATLAVLTPIFLSKSRTDAAYIEAKNEQ